MFSPLHPPPRRVATRVLSRLPDALRRPVPTAWAAGNRPGHIVDCFLESPCFLPDGSLLVVDIPHGRVLRLADGAWTEHAAWEGEPNGLKRAPDGRLLVADYRLGLLDLRDGRPHPLLPRRNSESFKGLNDLAIARDGCVYFTDQGQTGLHDPTGRVYRLAPDGRLDLLLATGPSPNGLALSPDERVLFVAMTRDNAVWRLPLLPDGSTAKVGRFAAFWGTSGPDGMAMAPDGRLFVCHASLGAVFVLAPAGHCEAVIESCAGPTITNLAFTPDGRGLVITDSATGSVLAAEMPPAA